MANLRLEIPNATAVYDEQTHVAKIIYSGILDGDVTIQVYDWLDDLYRDVGLETIIGQIFDFRKVQAFEESNLSTARRTSNRMNMPFVADSNMGELAVAYDKAMPAWSLDDTFIGFHAKTANGRYGLFMGRPDGGGLRMIINPPDNSDVLHWAWSPDATQIVFSEMTNTGSNIYRLTLPDTIQPASVNRVNRELLIEDGFFPAWSPDGTKIVYMREIEGVTTGSSAPHTYTTLWLYDVISHVNKPLLPYPANPASGNWGYSENHPEWSSDGKYIIFASNRDNDDSATFDLYMVEVNSEGISSNLHRLTFSNADEQAPDWGIYHAGG